MLSLYMLDVLAIIYFTISNLYLLGRFPINIYEFVDLRTGYALSDYGAFFETGDYFSISAIITGLLCGLDAITNPIYKTKGISKRLYNAHALSSFALIGIGLYPISIVPQYPERVFHWLFALGFILVYPFTKILIVKRFNKRLYKKLMIAFVSLNVFAGILSFVVQFRHIIYPEYVMWVGVMLAVILGKLAITKRKG